MKLKKALVVVICVLTCPCQEATFLTSLRQKIFTDTGTLQHSPDGYKQTANVIILGTDHCFFGDLTTEKNQKLAEP